MNTLFNGYFPLLIDANTVQLCIERSGISPRLSPIHGTTRCFSTAHLKHNTVLHKKASKTFPTKCSNNGNIIEVLETLSDDALVLLKFFSSLSIVR